MYLNNGDFTFTEDFGGIVYSTYKVTSQAVGDLNHDGKMDIYASYCNIYNDPSSRNDKLWLNNADNGNHFITFRLQGVVSNRAGIGAKIMLYGPWGVQVREVRSGEAYGINNSFMKHFGIGTANKADSVVVYWPSGQVDHMIDIPADNFITMVEGDHLLSTSKNTLKTGVKVFPNPASGMVTIDVPAPGEGTIVIRDMSGRVIYQSTNVQRYNVIDINKWGNGIYTYEITTITGNHTGKLVKQ